MKNVPTLRQDGVRKMKYLKVREKINTGDILICQGTWLLSKLIRLVTWQKASHVGIAIWITINGGKKRLCMFEAMEGKDVRIIPLHDALKNKYWSSGGKMWWHKIKDSNISGHEIANFYLQHWSDGYADKRQFILILLPIFQWIRNFFGWSVDTNPDRWHCSEIATRSLMEQGYEHNKDSALTTPGDVADFDCLYDGVLIEPD